MLHSDDKCRIRPEGFGFIDKRVNRIKLHERIPLMNETARIFFL